MTMITPSYLGETIEYSSLHACRSTLEDPTVIGQRLKLSGMRWNTPGATAIATLRCQEASNRWDEIWQRPHYQAPPADLTTQAS